MVIAEPDQICSIPFLVLARHRLRDVVPAPVSTAHEPDAVGAVRVRDEHDKVHKAPHERGDENNLARVAAAADAKRHLDGAKSLVSNLRSTRRRLPSPHGPHGRHNRHNRRPEEHVTLAMRPLCRTCSLYWTCPRD
jgi:hypothetical protein